jgi:hypothetical protein
VIKAALAPLVLSLCFCVPALGERTVISVDSSAIKQEIRNAVRDFQVQLPEFLKAVRVSVQMSEIQMHIPVPGILIPAIRLKVPVNVQIPEIQLPEIHVQIPQIDVQVPKSPD